ncbi:MAG: glutathione S-transferase family protein [Nitratireductor sp.]
MMILDTFKTITDEPTATPFGAKAMCLLEMGGFEWEFNFKDAPNKAPKQKFPVLHDGDKSIADSEHIRMYLEDTYGVDFDSNLSNDQKAVSRAVIRMIEEHFYFIVMSHRWEDEANWQNVKKGFFGGMPAPLKWFVPKIVRGNVSKTLNGQGMGRHTRGEQLVKAKQDIDAIIQLLGKQDFLFGNDPSAADASVVASFRNAVRLDPILPLSDYILENKTLMAYLERGKDAMYPKN